MVERPLYPEVYYDPELQRSKGDFKAGDDDVYLGFDYTKLYDILADYGI